jgi:hypothetical protein
VEPSDAISVVETVLRQAVRHILGEDWSTGTGVDLQECEARRTEESKSRHGAVVDQDLLAYTYLWDLEKIVLRNWEQFKPIFKDQARFKVYMALLEDFRNAPAHSRSLLPYERDLLSGIAGEFRNVLTLWRSQRAPDMTWYPRIDSLTDSLGNRLDAFGPSALVSLSVRLKVGDLITFRCIGWDPEDRELTWTLDVIGDLGSPLDVQTGADVTLTWQVREIHVSEATFVTITLKSSGQYHRYSTGSDASVSVQYSVDPP